jgi:hypothetical protein
MLAQASNPTIKCHESIDLVGKQWEGVRAYPATTEHMPFLDPQLLAKTLNVRHEVPSGVVFNRSTPALPINTSGPDPAGP